MVPRGAILVADDDQATIDFIVEALTEEGYAAVGVSDHAAITAALLTSPPDLVLIDRHFGQMSGLDVVQAVRAWGLDTPLVIMTTNTRHAAALEAQGAVACLIKPFDLDALLACIARHIRPSQRLPGSAA
jgi:DNA-binding response OmpR family regulator